MSVAIMVFINTIFGLLGLFIIGVSSYGLATMSQWGDFVSKEGLIMVLVLGLFTFLVSFCGCFGAVKGNKVALGIYMFVEFLVTALMSAGAAMVLAYGGQLLSKENNAGRSMSNVVLGAWETCCADNLAYRNIPMPAGGIAECKKQDLLHKRKLWQCYYPFCDSTNQNVKQYCAFVPKPKSIAREMCIAIDKWVFNSNEPHGNSKCWTNNAKPAKIVNGTAVTQGYWPNGAQNEWTGRVAKWLADNMHTFGIGLAVMSAMLLVVFVASAALCCTHSEKFDNVDATA